MANSSRLDAMSPPERGLWRQLQRRSNLIRYAGAPAETAELNRLASIAIKAMIDAGANREQVEAVMQSGTLGWSCMATLTNHRRSLEQWKAGRAAKAA
jgi:hypothetical protein